MARRKLDVVSEFHTIWALVDSHWQSVSEDQPFCLAQFLWQHGFDIPDTITYCLAQNASFSLKYRVYGAYIHLFIHPLKN